MFFFVVIQLHVKERQKIFLFFVPFCIFRERSCSHSQNFLKIGGGRENGEAGPRAAPASRAPPVLSPARRPQPPSSPRGLSERPPSRGQPLPPPAPPCIPQKKKVA